MAQINKPTDYFNTVLYTGNATSRSITGVGFQPDWVWNKDRSVIRDNRLIDNVRGTNKILYSNSTQAEDTSTQLTSFDSDGFSINTSNGMNASGSNFVTWCWLAGGTASSNTDGSITSSVSVNTTSGFSIVSYTDSASTYTVGHGLGVAPSMIILKDRSTTYNWDVGHKSIGWGNRLILNSTSATGSGYWNNTAPTSLVFTYIGNGTGGIIAYCFAEKKGFSKFGSFTGNGSTDGPFVYTGFAPAWVVVKRTDSTGHWVLRDNKMKTFNVKDNYLLPSDSGAEATSAANNKMDFLSNGFKLRQTGTAENASGGTYIYMAFAESPLVGTNNIPACAR